MTPLFEAALELQDFFIRRQCSPASHAKTSSSRRSFPQGIVLDVETIVLRQHGRLDWTCIETQLRPLAELKEQPEIMDVFSKLRRR